MNQFSRAILCLCLIVVPNFVSAASDRSLDLTVEVQTQTADANAARRELLDTAAKSAIEDFLRAEFGDEAVNAKKSVVESKVLGEFSKYVPSSRSLDFAPVPTGGFKSSVLVKLNRTDLLNRAFSVGLRRPSELEPVVLPLWLWVDETQSSVYGWWSTPEQSSNVWLQLMAQSWESSGSVYFEKQGLQLLRPQHSKFATQVPAAQRKFRLEDSDVESVANNWRAPLVMTGFVRVYPTDGQEGRYTVQVSLDVKYLKNGRIVGQIRRSFPADQGPLQIVVDRKLKEIRETLLSELAEQVGESRRKGTLQANRIQIEFLGGLQPTERELLKRHLTQKFRGIREVRERAIEARRLVFDVDIVQDIGELAKEMKEVKVGQVIAKLDDEGSERLSFKLNAVKGAQ